MENITYLKWVVIGSKNNVGYIMEPKWEASRVEIE